MTSFKPLLSANVFDIGLDAVDYGNTWLSPKLDGFRAIVRNGVVMSRSLKPLANEYTQHLFGRPEYEHLDGEIIVGQPTDEQVLHTTSSAIRSKKGEPDVTFHVFDHVEAPNDDYCRRYVRLSEYAHLPRISVVRQHGLMGKESLLELEAYYLEKGYEGVMLRAFQGPQSWYKFGRSTALQGTLMKMKRFTDTEAKIVGYYEEMKNLNEATTDALGRTVRSSHAENKEKKGRLGGLILNEGGVEFRVGTGFSAKMREDLWAMRESLPGQYVKYKFFDYGIKDKPKLNVFISLRDAIDM